MSSPVKRRRLKLVLLVMLIGVIGLGGAYAYRKHRSRIFFATLRAEGLKAAAAGNHLKVVQSLEPYIPRYPDDIEPLVAYVRSRPEIRDPENLDGEVASTIVALRHLLRLQPDRVVERRQLLGLYIRTHRYWAEALDTAELLRNTYRDRDVETLRGRAIALKSLHRDKDALEAADEWVSAAPRDIQALMLDLELMALQKKSDTEIKDFATRAFTNPPDPCRANLIQGYALLLTQDPADRRNATKHLTEAAESVPDNDPVFANQLLIQLDGVGQSEAALAVVKRLYGHLGTTEWRYNLAARLWESGRSAELVELFATAKPEDDRMPPTLMAMHAIALQAVGRKEDAAKALEALKLQTTDVLATAWAAVLEQLAQWNEPNRSSPAAGQSPSTTASPVIVACQRAIEKNQADGYLQFFMGEAYARANEPELALKMWREAAAATRSWPAPLMRTSEMLSAMERRLPAYEAAREAFRRADTNPGVQLVFIRSWAKCIEAGLLPGTETQLLDILDSRPAGSTQPSSQVHPEVALMRAMVLARLGRTDEAAKVIRGALESSSPIDEALLLQYADQSQRSGLKLEQQCFDRSKRDHGMTADLAFAIAKRCFQAGQFPDGLKSFAEARAAAGGDKAPRQWQINWGQCLALSGDPRARSVLISLAAAEPDNPTIQAQAFEVSTRDDDAFRELAVERLRKSSGDSSLTWRLAKAKMLLDRNPNGPPPAEVAILLREVIAKSPNSSEPHLLLGTALEREKKVVDAIEQIRTARDLNPDSLDLGERLARLYEENGESEKAQAERDRQVAIASNRLTSNHDTRTELILALLYRQAHRNEKSNELLLKLMNTSADARFIVLAAEVYAQQGMEKEAEEALGRLDSLHLEPGEVELLKSEYFACRNKLDDAIRIVTSAIVLAPQSSKLWNALLSYQVAVGRSADAAAACEKARTFLRSDPTLQAIDQHKYVLHAATDPKLRGLAVAFVIDPINKNAGAAQALQLVWVEKLPAEVLCPQLEKIGDSYPELLELQLFLARTYLSDEVNDAEAAIAAARRAARLAPNSPIPYRLLVDATIRAKKWTECLPAARRLRERLGDDCFEADLAIAKAYVSLGRSEEAANQLTAYMNDPKSATYAAALTVISEADKASGGSEAVRKRLRPLLQSGPNGRAAWISYALGDRSLPLQESATLLREVAKEIAPDSVQELFALGDAWGQLATRSGDASCAKEARLILEPLAAKTDATVPILLVTASRLEQDGDLAAAQSLYRRVIAAGPSPVAQNNLAMLLVQDGGDLQEAQRLIADAINQQPSLAALHDTRAFVLAKANDPQAAVESVDRAIQLQPNNAEYRVHLAELLLQSGQRDKAQDAMVNLEKMPLALKALSSKARLRFENLRVAVADRTAAAAGGAESATR